MEELEFVKTAAAGNDFIIIDKSRIADCELSIAKLSQKLCRRKFSIGADGLLLIESSESADFKMRIFNPDGTEVQMCGNGARCAAVYARRNKLVSKDKIKIETLAGNLQAEINQNRVRLKMSAPGELRLKFDLDIDGSKYNLNYINTGVPHVVCFVKALDDFDVPAVGRAVRYHGEFQPQGTNADFVEVLNKRHIKVRTYERGVEEETLACGTGCVASAIITVYNMLEEHKGGRQEIKVDTRSGERLTVYFEIEKNKIDEVYLEGAAGIVYKGNVLLGGRNV